MWAAMLTASSLVFNPSPIDISDIYSNPLLLSKKKKKLIKTVLGG